LSDIAIRVENLGKQYKIGRLQKRHDTLRDQISDFRFQISDLVKRRNGHNHKSEIINQKSSDSIWALRDVSFEVKRGEVVGIIGRNGAGKSTLLKILSRITEPTTGTVDLYGRVASLLEVGTGFHPELTGRENIFLNGAILGMRKAEIERRFDEIVAFAEVEKFIDTPVKRYSSGMYVRLAFAVAAHLEPEILVVDEVLAVGDAAFQKKCLGKMGDVAREGRTVLFVSHNMAAVQSLCSRGIFLENGKLVYLDEVKAVISRYIQTIESVDGIGLSNRHDWTGRGNLKVSYVELRDGKNEPICEAISGSDVRFVLGYQSTNNSTFRNVAVALTVSNIWGQPLLTCWTEFTRQTFPLVPPQGQLYCDIPRIPLIPGSYWVNLSLRAQTELEYQLDQAFSFDVIGGDFFGTGEVPKQNIGATLVMHDWRLGNSENGKN